MIYILGGAFHKNFPGLSGFGFCRKLASTIFQQGTEKASEHNRHTVFSWVFVLLTHASTGVVPNLSYNLFSILITLPNNLCQLSYSPPPPPLTEYDASSARVGL